MRTRSTDAYASESPFYTCTASPLCVQGNGVGAKEKAQREGRLRERKGRRAKGSVDKRSLRVDKGSQI
eukprot:5200824-Pleurochrysis_carterae.AAC.1